MAKVKQTVTYRRKKVGTGSEYIACNMCRGTGRVKNGHRQHKNKA